MNQDQLLASASIERLMHDYCTAIDHGDFARFGLLMRVPDGWWRVSHPALSPRPMSSCMTMAPREPNT